MNNKICVYAIAKNEAKFAETWYNSMKEADCVVVLDTGSTDNTVELLTSLGASVYQTNYEHFRFDVARNESMSYIPEDCNICVCTDLDEQFEPGWADVLRSSWNDDIHCRALYPYVHDHLEDGSEGFVFTLDKIHSRNNAYWRFAVHEVLFVDGYTEETTLTLTEGVRLHHYPDLSKSRVQYIDLLKERLAEDPNDSLGQIQYAMELKTHRRYEEAIAAYQDLIHSGKLQNHSSTEVAGVFCQLGECYEMIDEVKSAIVNYSIGISENAFYRENYYCLARVFMLAGMYDMAIGIAKQGLETSVRQYHWIEGIITWAWGLYDILWRCYYEKGEYDTALAYAAAALNKEPGNPVLQEGYLECLKALTNE